MLLPIPAYRGPDFEERLRMSMDVDALIDQSNQELKDYANKRIPLPGKSLSEKDEDLLKKVSLIATAVKVEGPPILAPDVSFNIDYSSFRSMSNILQRSSSAVNSPQTSASLWMSCIRSSISTTKIPRL